MQVVQRCKKDVTTKLQGEEAKEGEREDIGIP